MPNFVLDSVFFFVPRHTGSGFNVSGKSIRTGIRYEKKKCSAHVFSSSVISVISSLFFSGDRAPESNVMRFVSVHGLYRVPYSNNILINGTV